jgi:Protein of unknown function (DUF992)
LLLHFQKEQIVLSNRKMLALAALAAALIVSPIATRPSSAGGVAAGFLKCDVAGNVSFVFGSSRDLTCVYDPGAGGAPQHYTGTIKTFGVDIGYQSSGVMIWSVVAPTNNLGAGALAGDYAGATATVAAGLGVGANALVGGYQDSVALQPLSVQGVTGINVAGGIGSISLQAAP